MFLNFSADELEPTRVVKCHILFKLQKRRRFFRDQKDRVLTKKLWKIEVTAPKLIKRQLIQRVRSCEAFLCIINTDSEALISKICRNTEATSP